MSASFFGLDSSFCGISTSFLGNKCSFFCFFLLFIFGIICHSFNIPDELVDAIGHEAGTEVVSLDELGCGNVLETELVVAEEHDGVVSSTTEEEAVRRLTTVDAGRL
jgi:hypothetical protein